MLLTIIIVRREDALEGSASAAPVLVAAVVAGGVHRAVLGVWAERLRGTSVLDHCILYSKFRKRKPSLVLAEFKSESTQKFSSISGTTINVLFPP